MVAREGATAHSSNGSGNSGTAPVPSSYVLRRASLDDDDAEVPAIAK